MWCGVGRNEVAVRIKKTGEKGGEVVAVGKMNIRCKLHGTCAIVGLSCFEAIGAAECKFTICFFICRDM